MEGLPGPRGWAAFGLVTPCCCLAHREGARFFSERTRRVWQWRNAREWSVRRGHRSHGRREGRTDARGETEARGETRAGRQERAWVVLARWMSLHASRPRNLVTSHRRIGNSSVEKKLRRASVAHGQVEMSATTLRVVTRAFSEVLSGPTSPWRSVVTDGRHELKRSEQERCDAADDVGEDACGMCHVDRSLLGEAHLRVERQVAAGE